MKRVFILLFLISVSLVPLFAQNGKVPFGQNTTSVRVAEPMFKEISITKQDNKYYSEFLQMNQQISFLTKQIQSITANEEMQKIRQAQLAKVAPADNTRVSRPVIPQTYQKKGQGITQKLETKKQTTELSEKENLSKELKALKIRKEKFIKTHPNISILNTQQQINDAYVLYQYSADWYNNQKPPQGFTLPPQEIAKVINKTYELSPKELQTELSYELTKINSKMQKGSGYKSFVALEKEVKKINKTKREDAIIMSIFTWVAMYKFTGVKITAPASALHWWSGPMWAFRAKKLLNFMMTLCIYGAIDEANLNVVGASFEEMITRFTFLQDNYGYLKDVISSAQKNTLKFGTKSLPNNWTNDDEHRRAVKRLYALKFINLYLSLSSVSYKYDLALMDLMNLFSDKPEVYFDFTVFDKYENGSWNKTEKTNHLPTQNMAFNPQYGASSASALIPRSQNMINNLKKLPKNLYYKKVYYKGLYDNEDSLAEVYLILGGKQRAERMIVREGGMILYPVPPQHIIRDEKGTLRDCSPTLSDYMTPGGEYMEMFNGHYYMRIEPAANDKGTFYRGKPKTYVFEDINTKTKECGRQTNLIMA